MIQINVATAVFQASPNSRKKEKKHSVHPWANLSHSAGSHVISCGCIKLNFTTPKHHCKFSKVAQIQNDFYERS